MITMMDPTAFRTFPLGFEMVERPPMTVRQAATASRAPRYRARRPQYGSTGSRVSPRHLGRMPPTNPGNYRANDEHGVDREIEVEGRCN